NKRSPRDRGWMNFTSSLNSALRTRKRYLDGFEPDCEAALRSRFDYRIGTGFILIRFIVIIRLFSIDIRLGRSHGQPPRSIEPSIQRLIATDISDDVLKLIDIP